MATKKYMSLERLQEYDALIKADVNASISNHTSNSSAHVTSDNKNQWNSAYTHSTSAHAPSNAEKNIIVGIQKNGTDLTVDSSTRKINITVPTTAAEVGAAASGHNHDSDYDAKGAAASALDSAKDYTAQEIAKLLNNSTEAVDSIYELRDAMEENADAIDALREIASSKATQTSLDSHTSNTTAHITSTERTNWNTAYTHSQAAHAPSNAQANVIESIKVNGTAQTVSDKSVNITVPTKASDIDAAPADHTHTVDTALSSSSTNPVQNKVINGAISSLTSTVSANTSSISSHSTAISGLQTALAEIQEITSAEISALFA